MADAAVSTLVSQSQHHVSLLDRTRHKMTHRYNVSRDCACRQSFVFSSPGVRVIVVEKARLAVASTEEEDNFVTIGIVQEGTSSMGTGNDVVRPRVIPGVGANCQLVNLFVFKDIL